MLRDCVFPAACSSDDTEIVIDTQTLNQLLTRSCT